MSAASDPTQAGVPTGALKGAYFDGVTAARHEVIARPQPGSLMFEGKTTVPRQILWPWAEVQLLDANRDGNRIVLRREGEEGPRLTLEAPGIRETLKHYAPHLGGAHHGEGHWRAIKIGVGIAAVLAVAVVSAPYVARVLAPLVPDSAMNALGWETVDTIAAMGGGMCEIGPGRDAIDKMTTRVLGDTELPYPLIVHVADHEMVNAFAAPGGHVVIMNGLILKAETPEEVAGVLAHEIGHVKHRHAEQNLVNAFGMQFLIGALIGGNVGETAHLLLRLSHSRDAEREADEEGIHLLEHAGLATGGFAAFFERFQKEAEEREEMLAAARKESGREEDDEDGLFDSLGSILTGAGTLLSTHPPSEERIERAHASAGATVTPVLTDTEWESVKTMCRDGRNAGDDADDDGEEDFEEDTGIEDVTLEDGVEGENI